ncbi:MAG: DegT/DnrJ/EryC1/StrS family aminotransferase [Candidatus Niyogibacteria bacterium]|nr:DegT/DnrJ/EryC1/StrS family aminotransferase [Candidatus Niyogibacteria bacterium]
MKNKKIPWWMPQIGNQERKLIKKVLDTNFINEGPLTYKFEQKVAQLLNVSYAVATTSGTTALFLVLKGLNIGHGDEVIVPDFTFIATANAVHLTGAKPILVDIDPETANINSKSAQHAITPRTKAIIPVHMTGRAANMKSMLAIAKKYNIYVVEDAAESFMSQYNGRYLGAIGDAGCFSFSPNKTITTGQGGMIVTNNKTLYQRIKELKNQGRPFGGAQDDRRHNIIGYNFKFTDIQAALGLGQLCYLNKRIQRMKKIYRLYADNLKNVKRVTMYKTGVNRGEIPQWTDAIVENRDALNEFLKAKNVFCRPYSQPLHTQPPYRLPDSQFPNSTKLCSKSIWLPSAFTLSNKDILTVSKYIREFYAER